MIEYRYEDEGFNTKIRENVALAEMPLSGHSIFVDLPYGKGDGKEELSIIDGKHAPQRHNLRRSHLLNRSMGIQTAKSTFQKELKK